MRKASLGAAVLVILAVGFLTGSWFTWRTAVQPSKPQGRKVLYWVDPMHPSYKSDKPGIAPDCGMQLEPVYADGASPASGASVPPNAVKVTPERQQLIGVQFAQVQSEAGRRNIRTVGRVVLDENRIYRVLTATDGIVRRLLPVSTGSFVSADQMLLDYYVSEALGAQQSFFYALTTLDRLKASGSDLTQQANLVNAQVRQAVEALRSLGMGEAQIAQLAKNRKPVSEIEIRSPVAGYVLARDVSPAQRFERGTELYKIADLSRVWIEANLFEADARLVRPGTIARLSGASSSDVVETRVSQVLPQFDPTTRTLKIRLETENPDSFLRPDMFVDVEMMVNLPRAISVPAEAVVDSGSRKVVFVDRGNGYFEPRRVETGARFEDRIQIVRGLMEGERIVVSGNFLLNSESRLQMTATGISNPETDPVCGMDVDRVKATTGGKTTMYRGQALYFCSEECRKTFAANPQKYAGEAVAATPAVAATSEHKAPRAATQAVYGPRRDVLQELGIDGVDAPLHQGSIFEVDPVCGADVDRTDPKALKSQYRSKTYYFVTKECKQAFDKEPDKYVKK